MGYEYHVIKVLQGDLEARINAAAAEGWEVVSIHASRMMYGLGGEYEVKEVSITLRRRAPDDRPGGEIGPAPLAYPASHLPIVPPPALDPADPDENLPKRSGGTPHERAA